jgi:transcription antitermination factor NusG
MYSFEVEHMAASWYVLRSKPRKEDTLWQHAVSRGFKIFYPRLPIQPVNPRARKVVPFFPGYMFVHVDLATAGLSTFQWMPNAAGLICFDGVPADVPAELIDTLRQRVGAIVAAEGQLFYGLKPGDPVIIRGGPLAGYEAMFDTRLGGGERARVLLDMLNDRRVPVELAAGQIVRK